MVATFCIQLIHGAPRQASGHRRGRPVAAIGGRANHLESQQTGARAGPPPEPAPDPNGAGCRCHWHANEPCGRAGLSSGRLEVAESWATCCRSRARHLQLEPRAVRLAAARRVAARANGRPFEAAPAPEPDNLAQVAAAQQSSEAVPSVFGAKVSRAADRLTFARTRRQASERVGPSCGATKVYAARRPADCASQLRRRAERRARERLAQVRQTMIGWPWRRGQAAGAISRANFWQRRAASLKAAPIEGQTSEKTMPTLTGSCHF